MRESPFAQRDAAWALANRAAAHGQLAKDWLDRAVFWSDVGSVANAQRCLAKSRLERRRGQHFEALLQRHNQRKGMNP